MIHTMLKTLILFLQLCTCYNLYIDRVHSKHTCHYFTSMCYTYNINSMNSCYLFQCIYGNQAWLQNILFLCWHVWGDDKVNCVPMFCIRIFIASIMTSICNGCALLQNNFTTVVSELQSLITSCFYWTLLICVNLNIRHLSLLIKCVVILLLWHMPYNDVTDS